MSNECCVISEGNDHLNNWTEATLGDASEGSLGDKKIAVDTSPRAQKVQQFFLDHFRDLQIEIAKLHKESLNTETPFTGLLKMFEINLITQNKDPIMVELSGVLEDLNCETDLEIQQKISNDNIKSDQEEAKRIAQSLDRFFNDYPDSQDVRVHAEAKYQLFADPNMETKEIETSGLHKLEWNLNIERDSVDSQEVLSEGVNIV